MFPSFETEGVRSDRHSRVPFQAQHLRSLIESRHLRDLRVGRCWANGVPNCISTIGTLFPQHKIYETHLYSVASRVCFKSSEERSSRRREKARAIKRTSNGAREAFRQLEASDGTEKALATSVTEEKYRKCGLRGSQVQNNPDVALVVIWTPNQVFENRKEGARSRKGARPFALYAIDPEQKS